MHSFAETLTQTIRPYQNRAIEVAQVTEELIALAEEMREANTRDETLRTIARKLVETVRRNVTIDGMTTQEAQAVLNDPQASRVEPGLDEPTNTSRGGAFARTTGISGHRSPRDAVPCAVGYGRRRSLPKGGPHTAPFRTTDMKRRSRV